MHSVVGGNGTVKKLTTSLRAFLRYLAVKGRCRAGLADVVPGYAHWRLADLPRYLAAEQVNRLIAACDGEVGAPPSTAAQMRNSVLSEIFSIEARRAECGMIGADVRPNWSERGEPDRRASGDEARSPS